MSQTQTKAPISDESEATVAFAVDKRIFSKKAVVETIKLLCDFASFELMENEREYLITVSDIVEDVREGFDDEFHNYLIYVHKGLSLRKKVGY